MFYDFEVLSFDEDLILDYQSGIITRLDNIGSKKLKASFCREDVIKSLKSRLNRYKSRLADEFKLRKSTEIENMYESHIQNIADYMIKFSLDEISVDIFIREIHKLLYPKGCWAFTLSPSGQRSYRNYPTGIRRDHPEKILLDNGIMFEFAKPDFIDFLMKKLFDFYNSSKLNFFIKSYLFCYIFFGIHPFSDGNGTVQKILFESLFFKEGYGVMPIEDFTSDIEVAFTYENNFPIDFIRKISLYLDIIEGIRTIR